MAEKEFTGASVVSDIIESHNQAHEILTRRFELEGCSIHESLEKACQTKGVNLAEVLAALNWQE
ncbi:MAG: hypothetical protein WCW26_01050 [Candidatus Buchananbacteria bacterium]